MKNAKESLYIIPNECIVNGEIKNDLTMDDISSFQLKIYKYKNINGKSEINRLFNLIRPRQQIISQITYSERNSNGSNKVRQRRWIITSNPNIYNEGNENCYKIFKVEEFQSILKGKRLKFYQDNVIQLWNKEKEESKEGILDNFEEQTGWKIDYVDENARYETIKAMDTIEKVLQTNYTNNKVTTGGLLFSFNVNTNLTEGEDIYFQFDYKNGVVSNSLGKVMEGYDKSNSFGDKPVNSNIIKIDAYHYSIAGNRYGIKYILTLKNGDITERHADFYNCVDNKLTIDEIKFTYETGKEIEKTSKKFINIDSDVDDTWWNYLNTIQDKFNCLFVFNSYTRTMSCISRNSLNTEGKYSFNFNKNLISYETESEDSTFINGLKVTSSNEDVSIVSQNYFGNDTIYDYSYYVKNNLMSDELINKWREYETILIDYQNQWSVLQDLLSVCKQQKLRTDNEITTLSSQEDTLLSLLNNYQNNNDTTNQARIKSELDEITNRRNKCVQLSNSLDNSIKEYSEKIANLNENSKPKNVISRGEKIFTDDNIQELNDITYIEELQDDYFTESYSLYKYSIEYLKNKLIPTMTFKCNIVNLAKLLEQDWKKIMVLGYKYRFEDLDEKTIEDLGGSNLLIFKSYTFNINKRQVKDLTFVNKLQNSKDINKNIVAGIRKKQDRIINTLTNYNTTTNNAKSSYNFVQETYKNGINLSDIKLNSKNETNINKISENGYIFKDAKDENKAIMLTSGKCYTTIDNWQTSTKYMDCDRIVADVIKGNLLMGKRLVIGQVNENGSDTGQFYVGNFDEKHKQNNEGNVFGIQINDNNKVEKIFLGLEYDKTNEIQKPLFILKDNNGKDMFRMEENLLYVSGKYEQYASNGKLSIKMDNNKITIYNYGSNDNELLGGFGVTKKNNKSFMTMFGSNKTPLQFTIEDEKGNKITYQRMMNNKVYTKKQQIIDTLSFGGFEEDNSEDEHGKMNITQDGNFAMMSDEDKRCIFGYIENNTKNFKPILQLGKSIDNKYQAYLYGNIHVEGDFEASGTKNRSIPIENNKLIKMNCVEGTECYFIDKCTGTTNDEGNCTIQLDEKFLKTVTITDEDSYDVLVIPYYSKSATPTNLFAYCAYKDSEKYIVYGKPETKFSCYIIAKQKGFENVRMEVVDSPSSHIDSTEYEKITNDEIVDELEV